MRILRLKYITEKGRTAINKQNEINKKNWKLRAMIRATGGKLVFIDGGLEFSHFSFKIMRGDLNSQGNKQSQNMKNKGFYDITKALEKDDCTLDVDYNVRFEEVD